MINYLIVLCIMIIGVFLMAKRELTHLYHEHLENSTIAIGASFIVDDLHVELFEKALVLTSDLKRLPYLLGGKLVIAVAPNIATNLIASGTSAITVDVVLMNGNYDANEFDDLEDVFANARAKDDILLISHGYFHSTAGNEPTLDIMQGAWDFEGQKILYDTLSLLMFSDTNVNVASSDFTTNVKTYMAIEVDWKPLNKAELMEFLMEHIYAKQGD